MYFCICLLRDENCPLWSLLMTLQCPSYIVIQESQVLQLTVDFLSPIPPCVNMEGLCAVRWQSSPLAPLLRPQKLLFLSFFHSGWAWSHGPARLFLTSGFTFFLYIFLPTKSSNEKSLYPDIILVSWLPVDLWATSSVGMTATCMRKDTGLIFFFIVTQTNKCVKTELYLDSSIKPAGCRQCILGSSTLVFVWEGVPACGSDFFFLLYKESITDVQMNIFIILCFIQNTVFVYKRTQKSRCEKPSWGAM